MAGKQERAGKQPASRERHRPIAGDDGAEALLRSTLDALSAHVAVLDETGTIIAVNDAWRAFAAESGYVGAEHGLGANYLAVCEASASTSLDAARTARALRQIMAGTRSSFRMEYPCIGPDGARWFQLRVTCPKAGPIRRIVVAHEDITDVKRAEESLARLNARILQLQDEERRRIARELHDTTAQNLLAISLNAARLHDGRCEEQAPRIAAEILCLAEQSLQEIRTLSYLLHPPLLDEIGLEAALKWLAKGFAERSGMDIQVHVDDLGQTLSQEIATALFRVAQEALLNVRRHSGSDWARLSLRLRGGCVELDVEDRGRGMATLNDAEEGVEAQAVGVGISGMRLRLEQLGGRLVLRSSSSGVLVQATVPLAPALDTDGAADLST
jgi:two-component system, NarL family, sensor kinase